jgi:hypothetical protein
MTLLVKSKYKTEDILYLLFTHRGLEWHGTIYNPKSFLSLTQVSVPNDRQKYIAQELSTVLIGKRNG